MVKTNLGLSLPVPVQQGIKQGCHISGQFYSLAIKPLLCTLRDRLSVLSLPGFSVLNHSQSVYAYADDINIFVSDQADV